MVDLLPETNPNKIHKHILEYIDSINHINMFKQHYDDIPRYTKPVYSDRFQQININIPIEKILVPLQKNIKEIDTIKTTEFDGEYICLYRGEKTMKIFEVDMNLKTKVDAFNFVHGVNGGRSFSKFQIRWLNKHNH